MFGHARRSSVGTMGPCSNAVVRALCTAGRGGASAAVIAMLMRGLPGSRLPRVHGIEVAVGGVTGGWPR